MKTVIQTHTPAARTCAGCLLGVIVLASLVAAHAQPIQPEVIFSFNGTNGANPQAALTQGSDGNLYGTTYKGGVVPGLVGDLYGTVFKVTPDGTLTSLVSFDVTNGAFPSAALILGNDGNFYGTTAQESSSGSDHATGFRMTANGTLTTLHSFASANEGYLRVTLTLGPDDNFYGTTAGQGADYGTVFRMTTTGQLTTLVSFTDTNGSYPSALTLAADGNFYGTTYSGGSGNPGVGTVFKVTTNGTFTTLISFDITNASNPLGLTLGSDGSLYGTTFSGGTVGAYGTVFRITTNGTLTTIALFDGVNAAQPRTPLTLGHDGNFYGASENSVYQVTPDGALATVVVFNDTSWWVTPRPTVTIGSDGNLYGTTAYGGSDPGPLGSGYGRIFRLRPQSPVMISHPLPESQVIPGGVNVTLQASAFGAAPSYYQWTFNSTNLPSETNASLTLNNVSPAMSGNYALRVTNSLGFAVSSNASLTVLPVLVTTLPATGLSATGAVLRGSVTVGPAETLVWFEWGTDTNYGQIRGLTNLSGLNATVTFSNVLAGLNGDLINSYRLVASNSYGLAYGDPQSFQSGLRPSAITLGAMGSSTNDIACSAMINPNGRSTTAWFQWGLTTNYGNLTPTTSVGNGAVAVNFSNPIVGLSVGTPYHVRVVASNSLGLVTGADTTFVIGGPLAVTGPATFITGTNAWLNGWVTPNTLPTTAWFEWGTNTSYGNSASLGLVGNGSAAMLVRTFVDNLEATSAYHSRLVASNSVGMAVGSDEQFSLAHDAHAQSVLADQPLVYYRFDEAGGTTALNLGTAGAAGNGTYGDTVALGNPSLVPAFGFAAGFNNSNSMIAVPALGTNNQVTIEVWAKPRSFGVRSPGSPPHSSYNSIYTADNYVSGALHTHFFGQWPSQRWQVAINPSHTDIEFGNPGWFPSNSWVHLVATHDSPARRTIAYINGRAVFTNSSSTTVPVNLTAAHIGNWTGAVAWGGADNWFDGMLDELALYTNVLSASRIQEHYQTAIGNPVLFSTQTTNRLNLSWAGPGFRLQSNTNLSNPGGWTNVPAGSNSPVSVTVSNSGHRFFRLKWP
jgi:uncharacterized repeat protein (TIGR03803 family)